MRFRKSIFGIISLLVAGLVHHLFKETGWAIVVERVLEEAAHSLHIEKAAMAAALFQVMIIGAVIWLCLQLAFRIGQKERPVREDAAVAAQREHAAAIAEQTEAMRSPRTQTVRSAFSQTQSIKVLPPFMGGNMTLTLDNVATLRLHLPYSMQMLTLLLDVVPMDMRVVHNENIQVQGAQGYFHSGAATYTFDAQQRKRQEITVADRTFIVTLLKIGRLDISGVANPIEYVFGISEK
jgi:hypothetical protein